MTIFDLFVVDRVSVLSTGMASAVVELFIAYAEWFFPGGKSTWPTPCEIITPSAVVAPWGT